MENKTNYNSTSIFTLLAGVAAGAALGLLFAPENGAQTRRRIYSGAKKIAEPIVDRVQTTVEDVIDWGGDLYSEATSKNESSAGAWLTALIAIPVGAAIGVLFAPAKGSETRQVIADGAIKSFDSVIGFASNLMPSNGSTHLASAEVAGTQAVGKAKKGKQASSASTKY